MFSKKIFKEAFEYLARRTRLYLEIIRYVISGGSAALVELILLYLFTELFNIWYIYSLLLAFFFAFLVSFFLQKLWTFRDRGFNRLHFQLSLHLAVTLGGLGFNVAFLYLLVEKVGLWYMLAQVLIAGIIAIFSFLIYKFIIFKQNEIFSNNT